MAKLTARRLVAAEGILDRYRDELLAKKTFRGDLLESELKDCWKMSYQEIKSVMLDLLKNGQYQLVTAHYMEQGSPGIANEFRIPLANLYGTRPGAPDYQKKRAAFWEQALAIQTLTDAHRDALLNLATDPGKMPQDIASDLARLGLIEKRGKDGWDYTGDGESLYYKLKAPAVH